MMYAASSRRSAVRLQRQASSKRNLVRNDEGRGQPASTSSAAIQPSSAGKPTSPDSTNNRIRHSKDTFLLADADLQHFHDAFCFMAKGGKFDPSAPADAPQQKSKKRNKPSAAASPQRPWEDDSSSITLSISDFFATFSISHSFSGGFLDGLFDLIGTQNLHAMTFGEFVEGMCTFGMFKLDDMLRFVFFVLDKEKEGRIPRLQLLRFVESLHGKKVRVFEQAILPGKAAPPLSKEGSTLRLPAAERQRACVDYPALKQLCHNYPALLEPMLLFQSTLRRRVLGEKWWRRKEKEIERHFRTLDQTREKKRRQEEKRLLTERRTTIRSEIGWLMFYLRGRARCDAEKGHPKPVVSLDEETGEVRVDWTRTDGKVDAENKSE